MLLASCCPPPLGEEEDALRFGEIKSKSYFQIQHEFCQFLRIMILLPYEHSTLYRM